MIQGEAGFMKQLMLLICFALGFDSSEGKKCCVSRAYAVCWVTPNFWENALTDKKKKKKYPYFGALRTQELNSGMGLVQTRV